VVSQYDCAPPVKPQKKSWLAREYKGNITDIVAAAQPAPEAGGADAMI
jgi:hypothetical protein